MSHLLESDKRLLSLDVFRGGSMAAMVVVNDPGNWEVIYPQLVHVEFELTWIRIPGVLQRIAIIYVCLAVIFLYAGPRFGLFWFFAILAGYYLVMSFVPVPGVGPPTLHPEKNFITWFDRLILEGYLGWNGRGSYDITGIFTSIPAIPAGIAGNLTGRLLLNRTDARSQIIRFFMAGNALMAAGLTFGHSFPVIRNLCTSSYTLYTTGIALVCFAALYWLVDVRQYNKRLGFFLVFGRNALFAYILSTLYSDLTQGTGFKNWMYEKVLSAVMSGYNASLAYSLLNLGVVYVPLKYMYDKNIMLKI